MRRCDRGRASTRSRVSSPAGQAEAEALTGTGTTAAAAAIVHLGLPPLCSRAVDGDDDDNGDSDDEDVGDNIAAGGAKDGTMMHDGAMSSTQYLGGHILGSIAATTNANAMNSAASSGSGMMNNERRRRRRCNAR